jgi:hypothetical protein
MNLRTILQFRFVWQLDRKVGNTSVYAERKGKRQVFKSNTVNTLSFRELEWNFVRLVTATVYVVHSSSLSQNQSNCPAINTCVYPVSGLSQAVAPVTISIPCMASSWSENPRMSHTSPVPSQRVQPLPSTQVLAWESLENLPGVESESIIQWRFTALALSWDSLDLGVAHLTKK